MSKIRSYFFAETFKARVHFPRPAKSGFHMRENVLSSKVTDEFGLLQHPGRLLARPAEKKSASRFSEPVGKDFERMETRGVDCRHIAHAKHHHSGEFLKVFRFFSQLVRRSK